MVGAPHNRGRRALAALAELARGSARPPTPAQLDGGLQAVRSRFDRRRGDRRAVVRRSVIGSLAAASVLALVIVVRPGPPTAPPAPPPLAYQIEGGSVVGGGYLRESGRAGIRLRFAEGTEFDLMPGTRSRLRTVDGSGARIAIEHGTASFRVTPAPRGDRRWQVDVGPFLVTVKGTVFTVSWDAAREKFELRLRHGRVTVSGPVTGEIALRAGQRLAVDLPRGETVISEQRPDEWSRAPIEGAADTVDRSVPPADRPVAGGPSRSDVRSTVRSDGPRLQNDRRWAQALAAGHLDQILREAEHAGVRATLEKASGEDLLALADAARYRRRMDLARDTLVAARERFPDSPRALDAAFLLGRVHEASEGGVARAIEWYDEYLTRAPAGTYASEALGRKMTLTSKLQGVAGARPIAEEYLRRFPAGIYAGSARAFLRAP